MYFARLFLAVLLVTIIGVESAPRIDHNQHPHNQLPSVSNAFNNLADSGDFSERAQQVSHKHKRQVEEGEATLHPNDEVNEEDQQMAEEEPVEDNYPAEVQHQSEEQPTEEEQGEDTHLPEAPVMVEDPVTLRTWSRPRYW